MKLKLLHLFASLLLFATLNPSYGEGTKQLQPTPNGSGNQCKLDILDKNENGGTEFASYAASPDERLHIHINNPLTEAIYFGFGIRFTSSELIPAASDIDVYYRIKDPAGNVVFGPFLMPNPGQPGFITSHSEALAGPMVTAGLGGYHALSFLPTQAGDYYIEFNANDPNNFVEQNFKIDLFDITVVNTLTNQAQNGRLWAKVWDMITLSGTDALQTSFYIYTPDGVVSKVDYSGMQPWGFNVYANSIAGLKSSSGRTIQPEYKLFLNNPDPTAYPSGDVFALTASTAIDCDATGYWLNVFASKAMQAQIYLDLNGVAGYQEGTEDVPFSFNLAAGKNQIPWDGKNGKGQYLPPGTAVSGNLIVQANRINLPVHDAENHPNGFVVTLVRPYANTPSRIYYDDRGLPGGTENSGGCVSTAATGCHSWTNDFGNKNVINTWWFTQDVSQPFSLTLPVCTWQAPRVKVTKTASTPQLQPDGSYNVTFTFSVQNLSILPLSNVQVTDDLTTAFPAPATFRIVSGPVATGTLIANTAFQGSLNTNAQGTNLLAAGSTLAGGATQTITLQVNVNLHGVFRNYENLAVAKADTPWNTPAPPDQSTVEIPFVPNSVIGVAKAAEEPVRQRDGSYDVTYSLIVKNLGNAPLHEVQILEDLTATFPAPVTTFSLKSAVNTTGTLVANTGFDGLTHIGLLNSTHSTLPVGATEKITFLVNIVLHNPDVTTFYNSVLGAGLGPDNHPVVDTSHVGTNPDPNGNGNPNEVGESVPTPITIEELFIPEGYSPNGDHSHDTFVIRGVSRWKVNLEIFNRWGNLVYKNNDYQNDWDGHSNVGLRIGDELPDGTYYYVVKLSDGRKFVNYLTLAR